MSSSQDDITSPPSTNSGDDDDNLFLSPAHHSPLPPLSEFFSPSPLHLDPLLDLAPLSILPHDQDRLVPNLATQYGGGNCHNHHHRHSLTPWGDDEARPDGAFDGDKHGGTPTSDRKACRLLAELLMQDVGGPDGHRWFLPYLTTKDCFRLSECSKALLPYRHHLSSINIGPCMSPGGSSRVQHNEAMMRLVSGQQCLSYLRLGDQPVPDTVREGFRSGALLSQLKRLDLLSLSCDDAAPVVGELLSGGLQNLEQLNVTLSPSGFHHIINHLVHGDSSCCPRRLKRLALTSFTHFQGLGLITAALGRSHLRHLEELLLVGVEVKDEQEVLALAKALESGCCPNLRHLQLAHCLLRVRGLLSLLGKGLLSRRVCPKLEVLDLAGLMVVEPGRHPSGGRDDDDGGLHNGDGAVAIAQAMEAGGCSNIAYLDLNRIGAWQDGSSSMTAGAGHALAKALASGMCSKLRYLDISGNHHLGDEAVGHIVRALSFCGQLEHLGLSDTCMRHGAGQALVNSLSEKVWPRLKHLDIAGNAHLGDDTLMELGAATEGMDVCLLC